MGMALWEFAKVDQVAGKFAGNRDATIRSGESWYIFAYVLFDCRDDLFYFHGS